MKIELTNQFLDLVPILEKLQSLNFEAYFVGGSVRDLLINRSIHDIDITTNATPPQIKKAFKHIENYSGEKHGTVLALVDEQPIEITTFRIDGDYLDGRHPETVSFTNDLKEDLARRDFTINSLALDQNGQVTDFFNGLLDLNQKIIRAVGDPNQRFDEDGLRMIRAIRFAAQLSFKIEPNTLNSISNNKEKLSNISVERKRDEIEKLMLTDNPNLGLQLINQTELYRYLPSGKGQFEFKNNLKQKPNNKIQAWYLFRNYWKITDSADKNRFLKNDWKIDNQTSQAIKTIDENFLSTDDNQDSLKIKIFNLSNHFDDFLQIGKALNFLDLQQIANYQQIKNDLKISQDKDLKITGNDLVAEKIVPAGPKLGRILSHLLEEVILDKVENTPEKLVKRARELTDD